MYFFISVRVARFCHYNLNWANTSMKIAQKNNTFGARLQMLINLNVMEHLSCCVHRYRSKFQQQ